ncbi:MAG: hypothetical protein CVV41_16420 [Candidatus Riflebacteria bacterium HGW-Riflebacteria-1]|jgi:hypothetical protein|nr:MAG: hypothetical protein CVV41_16420 [Candidatus Riflebacteria bacterium HGW-Riflebacteria-1]
MISWNSAGTKLPAFAYYPLLEIGVGVFLLIMAFVVPILFLVYNGIKAEQWGELLFCAGFFVLFFFMGRALSFQSLSARRTEIGFSFQQNLREPAVAIDLKAGDWLGIRTTEAIAKDKDGKEIKDGEVYISIILKTAQGEREFYKSINRKEVNSIVSALDELRKKSEEKSP